MTHLYNLLVEGVDNTEVFYHGTKEYGLDKEFYRRDEANGGWLGDGYYFTNDIEIAREYGGNVLECTLRPSDTLVLTDKRYYDRPLSLTYEYGVWYNWKLTEKLKYNGYDSVLLEFANTKNNLDMFKVVCILDHTKIKIVGEL